MHWDNYPTILAKALNKNKLLLPLHESSPCHGGGFHDPSSYVVAPGRYSQLSSSWAATPENSDDEKNTRDHVIPLRLGRSGPHPRTRPGRLPSTLSWGMGFDCCIYVLTKHHFGVSGIHGYFGRGSKGPHSGDSIVLLGDFKAHVVNNSETWRGVIGKNGLLDQNLTTVLTIVCP